MNSELPFFAEYARTGRATCKGCKSSIPMDNLRIAVMVQSAFHDAKVPNWFHKTCFFKNQRPCSVGDIYNFGNLRFADQKELTNLVENLQGVISSQLGKKRSKAANLALKDFGIEYAKSSRSTCRGCEQKINKDLIRLRKTVYDTEVGMKYGGQPLWYHLDCFTQLRSELGWFDSGDNVPGFKSLADDDQAEVKNALPAIKSEELPETKRAKTELSDTNEEMEKNQHLKDQSDAYFKFRDDVKNIMKKKDIDILLKSNNQEPVTGDTEKLLDQTADLLTFGAIESCSECNSSQFTLNKSGYICNGNLSEWTKCNKLLAEPRRLACKVPKELKAAYHFLNAVSKMPSTRIFFNISPSKPTFSRNLLKTKKNSDDLDRYWIFRSWGRIGTNIGSSKLEEFDTCQSAKNKFKEVYTDKTGNEYEQRDNFVKITGRMYPIEIQYGDDQKLVNHDSHFINSKLEISVQNLIKLIFDVDSMKKTLVEFHIDMDKMPLGKLSAHQIQSAYRVVTEIFKILECGSNTARLIDATNRFYTLIPHNFGVQSPKLIETHQQIEDLRQMLDSLSEIEVAYSLIKSEDGSDSCHHLDKHYAQIKTQLVPLDKNSEEFSILSQYVKNTHASTHKSYDLEIIDVFKVSRQGEARRFKPFKKLHNRKLLWHGSRLTNFVGILSHGLKIAPPEAPPTGYMFGKGLYFADMVSKSANYCCTSQQNSTGLMLLSEVALGDMMECTSAKYINKLSNNKHSCFGRGRTMPDPTKSYIRSDGVEIPYGETITNENFKSSLLYNEYIVYDVAQVNIQYLFRMEFKYIY
ncbi:poly [ADP-ribose] polymerase isoform X2 [Drosophila teissieri]|uniref:poly [ADP-ribose] polymerase isoform X2 n=1 Tax=Drosophila teissieri TaxID=7243 RepID=UPI001CBA4CB1|nr:poly [ADP-ribose] polymerase isoform X2 [Drosophila teissieri]